MSQELKIFIGYDSRQPVAFAVAAHSAASALSMPSSITRLQIGQLPIMRRGLTEFTYSRFLVPYLSNFDGYSLFLDADVLVRADLHMIRADVDPTAAVSVVMHAQAFERPSVMLFNNKRCRELTPSFVDGDAPLFDLAWASKVGALPPAWNHLVGYDPPNSGAKIVHFTKGIPIWAETAGSEFAAEWRREADAMTSSVSFAELMGPSVHGLPRG
jgi:hypothetical protein